MEPARIGEFDRREVVGVLLSRLGARRSAWNEADIRGEVEQLLARAGVVTDPAVRIELAEDLTERAVGACVPLLDVETPEHIRDLTSTAVELVESDITHRLAERSERAAAFHASAPPALAGTDPLLVVEGAAGTGKTTMLRGVSDVLRIREHQMVVATPTLKAAQVASAEIGAPAWSAAKLVHAYGFRWDDDGRWTRTADRPIDPILRAGDLLVIDEAGMLDQDTARALLTIADETHARVAFIGDRHQLPAVGRGGVLDLAIKWAHPGSVHTLDGVRRFVDPDYADLSLRMRTGERPAEIFDELASRGQVVVHASEADRTAALAELGTEPNVRLVTGTLVQAAIVGDKVRANRVAAGAVADEGDFVTDLGQQIGPGDRVATRRNNYSQGVANREVWTVKGFTLEGVHLVDGRRQRIIDDSYARQFLELAYATTAYGVQGETCDHAHLELSDNTGAQAAYVAMTRGRQSNTVHVVADNLADARRQWVDVFRRDRADLGPSLAARSAAQDLERYGPSASKRRPRITEQELSSYARQSRGSPGIGI